MDKKEQKLISKSRERCSKIFSNSISEKLMLLHGWDTSVMEQGLSEIFRKCEERFFDHCDRTTEYKKPFDFMDFDEEMEFVSVVESLIDEQLDGDKIFCDMILAIWYWEIPLLKMRDKLYLNKKQLCQNSLTDKNQKINYSETKTANDV